MSATKKMKQVNGQSVMMVMEGVILPWVTREGLSEKATSEQDCE